MPHFWLILFSFHYISDMLAEVILFKFSVCARQSYFQDLSMMHAVYIGIYVGIH